MASLQLVKPSPRKPTTIASIEEAEKHVLQSILAVPDVIAKVSRMLEPSDFTVTPWQKLYEVMIRLYEQGKPPSLDIVYLNYPDFSDQAAELFQTAFDGWHFRVFDYAHFVKEASIRRQLAELGNEAAAKAEMSSDLMADIRELEGRLRGLDVAPVLDDETRSELLTQLVEDIVNPSDETGLHVPTGLKKLDDWMNGGMHRGDLILPAARTSIGKTALSSTILLSVGIERQLPCVMYSAEMTRRAVYTRLLSAVSKISYKQIDKHELTEADKERIGRAAEQLKDIHLEVVSASSWTVEQIAEHARELHEKTPLGLIVIDYLQILRPSDKSENRTNEIRVISGAAKSLAIELDVPVLALSQLNREPDNRKNKKPQLSDLRESGALEIDADLVWLISVAPDADEAAPVIPMVLDIAKYRNGPKGEIEIGFDKRVMRFVNYSPRDAEEF